MADVRKSIEGMHKGLSIQVLEFLSSGHYTKGSIDADKTDLATRYIYLNIFLFVGLSIFVPFTVSLAMSGDSSSTMIVIDCLFCLFLTFLYVLGRTKIPYMVVGSALVYAFVAFCCYMLIVHPSGGAAGGALWSFLLPPLAFSLLGNLGLIPTIIVSAAMIYAFSVDVSFYTYDFTIRTTAVFIFTIAFASLSVRRQQSLTNALMNNRKKLVEEYNEVAIMKDNMDAGIFLLDSEYIIQPFYSKHLPEILDIKEDLTNTDFFSYLKASLNDRELGLLKDFLDMVLISSYDTEMLDDVNPLKKFSYLAPTGIEKTLAVSFAQIARTGEEKALLVVARDVTYESQLEEKLAKEEEFRQNEMKSMFEIMHVSAQDLSEFLDEIDYEFARMNDALKDETRPKLEVYRDLFQGMHAMKSNALVIGLDSPAARFHEFEDKISDLLRKGEESYESMLEIVFELERVMDIVDNLKQIVKKMEKFSESSKEVGTATNIMLQAMQNTINKIKADGEKDAVICVKKLDWEEITTEHRRVIKEILLQFTRNSLAHGIEPFAVRSEKGKKDKGAISLLIEKVADEKFGSKIVVEYADDGAGIDFAKIKKHAIEKKLIGPDVTENNRSALIKAMFSPGFSTADALSMNAGRGIGLSLVSSRIKEYHGSIKVQSAPGQGTKFIVEIPNKKVS